MKDRLKHNYYRINLSLTCRITLLILLLAVTAWAQEFRGSLTGRITDPKGAALVGASVSVKNVETNIAATTTTNEDGAYSFPLLQPGKYRLTVTQQGFKAWQRDDIELRVADRLTLDVKLEVGAATESVQIVGSSPALETGSVSVGTVISSQQISELPLTEGTAYQLVTIAPGIFYTGNPLFTGPTSNGNLAAFRSNGATGRNQITLDGSPNYAFDGGVGFSPPSDAVQEFKVQTSVFDAQQGYSAGGTVNVAVKSGTNSLHGSLWYFNRDRSRTANNFFSNSTGQERPERTYHRFGGVAHGPVYIPKVFNGRDRTFFLFSHERLKDNVAEPQFFTVPTEKMRLGDFSDLLALPTPTVIFDPATAPRTGTGNFNTRTQISDPSRATPENPLGLNIIPQNRLNPIAVEYMKFFPLPNALGNADGTNNFFSNMIRRQNYRAFLTRIDHRISERQTIFGKYFRSYNPEDRHDWAGVVNDFPITKGFEYRTNDGGNIDYTITLSPTLVLDLRAGANRFAQERRPAAEFDPARLGFTGPALAVMRGHQYFPRFDIRTYDQTRPIRSILGSNRSDYDEGRLRPFQMASFQPTVTQIFGNHSAKYGYDFRVIRENSTRDGYKGGRFFFDGSFTTQASNAPTAQRNAYGRDVAAFLLGLPSASSQSVIENSINYSVQSLFHGFFFHDDWRVTQKLTLNLGLRYELEKGLTERYNRIVRGIDLTTSSPVEEAAKAAYTAAFNANPSAFLLPPDQFRVLGGLSFADDGDRNIWDVDKSNWQPRIGAAFKLTEKTVLRGGFGIFMAPFQVETPFQPGFSGSTPFVPTNDNGRNFIATLSNPFPNGVLASPGASLGLLTNVGLPLGSAESPVITVDRRNAKFARLIFGVQQELPGQFVVEANYVTAWGYDLAVARNLNFVPRQFLGDTPETDEAADIFLRGNIPINPFRNLLPNTGSPLHTAANITRARSLMAFPQFTEVWVQQYNGTNRYNSLQFQAQKRFSQRFTFTGTYTWTRLREKVNFLNPSDTELENRISPDERPHRYTLSGVYQLPIGRGRALGGDMSRALDAFIGGWQLNGTYEWQAGEPFVFDDPLFFAGDVTQLKSRVGQKDDQGRTFGVDISAFDPGLVALSDFGIRNVPTTLDGLRNQAFLNLNLSISKNFKLSEGKRLQFRAEWLNAFNTPYFGFGIQLDPSNQTFGKVATQRNNPRDVQLGLKFTF